ncbi:type III secretion protein [Burkholderia sp. Ac-20379]|uniref:type III secretion protein n=1 Tax=Burkholderia sp. Ac-20379 TaxID=2703900 RepID=UPI00197E471B|nr:type III secretion protein [Burkholderia sp. Ac-20379]MBN3728525.1 type III secretion protein [Burkholderia sp. Ac-20379]
MKLLRILTGTHAGAQLQLAPGAHRIGTDDAADIRLTDWRGGDLWLTVGDTGVVSAQMVAAAPGTPEANAAADGTATSGPLETILLVDFVPMQFDGTILCVGDEAGVWPSDYELLQTLMTKPAPKASPLRRRYLGIAAACFCVGAVIVTVSVLSTAQMSRAALPPNADDNAHRVTDALAAARIEGLSAHAVGDTVVVTGMLASSADDAAVRQLLRRLAIAQVAAQYDVAPQVARSIEDSLGVPGARVQYGGAGRFVIKGSVGNKMALDTAIARVRADLDPNVKDIVADVSESAGNANSADATAYSEMISADGVQYAQTPDGVKHIYASDPQPASGAVAPNAATGANVGANTGVSAPAEVSSNGAADNTANPAANGANGANGTTDANAAPGNAAAPASGNGNAPAATASGNGSTRAHGARNSKSARNAANPPEQPQNANEFVPLPSAAADVPAAAAPQGAPARSYAPMLASARRPEAPQARRAESSSRPPASPIAS